MLTVADYTTPQAKQIREAQLVDVLIMMQAIEADRSIPLEDEGIRMRQYVESCLRAVQPTRREELIAK